jgi:hypothetical protein
VGYHAGGVLCGGNGVGPIRRVNHASLCRYEPDGTITTAGLLNHRQVNNGGTEAINGISELDRSIARGFRNPTNYPLRMILAAGRFTHPISDQPLLLVRQA